MKVPTVFQLRERVSFNFPAEAEAEEFCRTLRWVSGGELFFFFEEGTFYCRSGVVTQVQHVKGSNAVTLVFSSQPEADQVTVIDLPANDDDAQGLRSGAFHGVGAPVKLKFSHLGAMDFFNRLAPGYTA